MPMTLRGQWVLPDKRFAFSRLKAGGGAAISDWLRPYFR